MARVRRSEILFPNLTIILVLLLFASTHYAFAWETKYHKTVTEQAIRILPDQFKQFLAELFPDLLPGVVDPDKNRVDNHKPPIFSITGKKVSTGGAHFALEKFANQVEEGTNRNSNRLKG